MYRKQILQLVVLAAVVLSSLGFAGTASAWSCSSYITVQWGDTLSGLAAYCGTTVEAIRAANPGLGWWVYAGQVLYIPGGSSYYYPPSSPSYGGNYVVQWGDTLAKIAVAHGVTVNDLLAANPNIWSPSLIYAGQVIYVPAAPAYHTVSYGDTLRKIAAWYGTTVYSLQSLNPQIYDINYIYPGQVIRVR
jgi:LysM repeat protein